MVKKNLILITLLLLVPLSGCNIFNGIITGQVTKEIEPPKIDYEEKIVNYENEIDKLNQEILNLNEKKEYYKNYSFNCYDLIQEKEKEIQEDSENFTNFWNELIKYRSLSWTGCKDSRTIRKFCKGCTWDFSCDTLSMSPTFTCENTLYFCSASKNEIKIGDIIAFISSEYTNDNYDTFYVIHRVIDITSDGKYITKGDGSFDVDKFKVPYSNVLGKLWKVEG